MEIPIELRNIVRSYNRDYESYPMFSLTDLINEALELGIDPRYVLNKAIIDRYRCRDLHGSPAEQIHRILDIYGWNASVYESTSSRGIGITVSNFEPANIDSIVEQMREVFPTVVHSYEGYENDYIDIGNLTLRIPVDDPDSLWEDVQSLYWC